MSVPEHEKIAERRKHDARRGIGKAMAFNYDVGGVFLLPNNRPGTPRNLPGWNFCVHGVSWEPGHRCRECERDWVEGRVPIEPRDDWPRQ